MSTYGSLPEGWSEVELMSLASVITDGAHSSPKPQNQGRFMCSVKDMTYNKFDFSNVKLISEEDYQFLLKQGCAPQKGDLLISKDGANCLDLLFLYEQEEEIVLLSSIAIVRLKATVCKEYVRYFLLSPDCQFIMRNNYVSGSAIPRVVLKDFKKVPIVLPPLPEQKAIASVLSSLDDKIDLLHRQNKTLEAMAETLFRQWFIEEAKEDWEVTPLSRIFDFLEGPGIRNWQYVENGVNFINIRLIDVGEVNVNSANKISEEEAFGKYKHFMLEEGDLIVSTSGTLGKSAIIRKYHLPLCLNTSVIRFRPKQDIYREFMYSYLKSRVFLEELETTASGSVQLNFGPTHLKKIDIRLPPTELIMSYHTITSEVFNKINSNFEQIQTLEKLRDTLLPKLMSGEVRVQYQTEEVV